LDIIKHPSQFPVVMLTCSIPCPSSGIGQKPFVIRTSGICGLPVDSHHRSASFYLTMSNLLGLPFEDDDVPLPPEPGDYEDFKRRYSIEIPGPLKRLLEFRNGGQVRPLRVTSLNSGLKEGLLVSRFLSLKAEDYSPNSIAGSLRGWREAIGKMGLPFATDPEGHLYFLDTSTVPAPVKYARQDRVIQVFTISPSLDNFLEGLHEEAAASATVGGDGRPFLYHGEDKVAADAPAPRKRGCCSVKVLLIGLGLFLLLDYWSRRPIWEDGNLRVYDMDGEYMLGIYHDPGYFGLLDEQVVAMGSNEQWVVAQQLRKGVTRFYILKKPVKDLSPSDVEGPFIREVFEQEVAVRGLPPFTWRNPWVKP
jgi:hypothetical protein